MGLNNGPEDVPVLGPGTCKYVILYSKIYSKIKKKKRVCRYDEVEALN